MVILIVLKWKKQMKNSYVTLLVEGKNTSLFINKLLFYNIKYDNLVKINSNKIMLRVSTIDYKLLSKIKTIYKIKIIKKNILKLIRYLIELILYNKNVGINIYNIYS